MAQSELHSQPMDEKTATLRYSLRWKHIKGFIWHAKMAKIPPATFINRTKEVLKDHPVGAIRDSLVHWGTWISREVGALYILKVTKCR